MISPVPSTVPGRTLHAFRCVPEGEVKAVLQLSHGMVEFIDRYKPLAEYLAGRGILVTGHDHLGHGGSIRTKADYGYFAEPDGNRAVLADLHAMTVRTKELYPGVPYFLLGHSMVRSMPGSICANTAMSWTEPSSWAPASSPRHWCSLPKPSAGCWPLSTAGSTAASSWPTCPLWATTKAGGRTTHDWLNRDQAEVDKYLADERCTFTFTLNAYYSMFSGILRLHDPAFLAKMPKDLPLLFLAGDATRWANRQGRAACHPEPERCRCAEH